MKVVIISPPTPIPVVMAVNILILQVIVDGVVEVGVFLPMDGPTPMATKITNQIIVSSLPTPVRG
jgi:hypothetical protein